MKYIINYYNDFRNETCIWSSTETYDEAVNELNKCLNQWGKAEIKDIGQSLIDSAQDEIDQLNYELKSGAYAYLDDYSMSEMRKHLMHLEEEQQERIDMWK